jgi:ubiquinone/menaquinone biosynthesis C-methylase UbiE
VSRAKDHVARVRAQFTRQAEAYAQMEQTRDRAKLLALVRIAGTTAGHRVLDVACGPGFLTMEFAGECGSALGVDATEAFVLRARREASERGLGNVEFAVGEADDLKLTDDSFDVVSCRAAFHHFVDPGKVLAEMHRVARPGGTLLVADMLGSEDPKKSAYRDRIETLCDPTHVRAIPESEFDALFREQGLEVALQPHTRLDYELGAWLEHGGPSASDAEEIRRLLAASTEEDRSGLDARWEDGRLHFSHEAAAFVLRVPAA